MRRCESLVISYSKVCIFIDNIFIGQDLFKFLYNKIVNFKNKFDKKCFHKETSFQLLLLMAVKRVGGFNTKLCSFTESFTFKAITF